MSNTSHSGATTWNFLMRRFKEDVNTQRRRSFSPFKLGYSPYIRVYLQETDFPTLIDKLREVKQTRLSTNSCFSDGLTTVAVVTPCHQRPLLTSSWSRRSKGDVTRDDSQQRFLAQHSVAMLEQLCNYSKQYRNNVATLFCAKNRRCESPRVTIP